MVIGTETQTGTYNKDGNRHRDTDREIDKDENEYSDTITKIGKVENRDTHTHT